jgi:hypothetical protein
MLGRPRRDALIGLTQSGKTRRRRLRPKAFERPPRRASVRIDADRRAANSRPSSILE